MGCSGTPWAAGIYPWGWSTTACQLERHVVESLTYHLLKDIESNDQCRDDEPRGEEERWEGQLVHPLGKKRDVREGNVFDAHLVGVCSCARAIGG